MEEGFVAFVVVVARYHAYGGGWRQFREECLHAVWKADFRAYVAQLTK